MKVTIKVWRRLLKMHEDVKNTIFYRDVKGLVDDSEKELRQKLVSSINPPSIYAYDRLIKEILGDHH